MEETKIIITNDVLVEEDIESWLYVNPQAVKTSYGRVTKWIGRQYQLPSGRADLIGTVESGGIAIVEVKNTTLAKSAITQVCRYRADIKDILHRRVPEGDSFGCSDPVQAVLVGPSIDDQTYIEALACDVDVVTFCVYLTVDTQRIIPDKSQQERREQKLDDIAAGAEWNQFGHLRRSTDELIIGDPDEGHPDHD